MTLPFFEVAQKGDETGWHRIAAWLAVAALTILYFSPSKARERWRTFATLLPAPNNRWVLYRGDGAPGLSELLIVHENTHVRDADRLGAWLFCALYVVNPVALILAILVSPWCLLGIFVLNPFRSYLEWRAYRNEWVRCERLYGRQTAREWARTSLPALFAGPSYGFMGPLRGLWLWWSLRRD